MVQAKTPFVPSPSLPHPLPASLNVSVAAKWKETASTRVLDVWSHFVAMDGADQESSFEQVRNIVNYLQGAATGRPVPIPGTQPPSKPDGGAGKKTRKKKKKKTKKKR